MMKSATVNSTGNETKQQKENNKQMALQIKQQKHNVSKVKYLNYLI